MVVAEQAKRENCEGSGAGDRAKELPRASTRRDGCDQPRFLVFAGQGGVMPDCVYIDFKLTRNQRASLGLRVVQF